MGEETLDRYVVGQPRNRRDGAEAGRWMTSSTGSQHWTPRAVLQRAIQVFLEEAVAALWFKVLGETVYRRVIVVERSLDEPIPDVRASVPVVIGWLDETQVEDLAALRPTIDPRVIRRRLAEGQACVVARRAGRLVFAAWSTTGRAWTNYLQCEIPLATGEVYVYAVFTSPESRGMNIASMALAFTLRHFQAAGYRRHAAVVMPENRRALFWFRKLGY
jgi:GNAT superfamily N-acetyltransferase